MLQLCRTLIPCAMLMDTVRSSAADRVIVLRPGLFLTSALTARREGNLTSEEPRGDVVCMSVRVFQREAVDKAVRSASMDCTKCVNLGSKGYP